MVDFPDGQFDLDDAATDNSETPATAFEGTGLGAGLNRLIANIKALGAKVGYSESSAQDTPVAGTGLFSDTNGNSKWRKVEADDITPGTATLLKIGEDVGTGSNTFLEVSSIPNTYRSLYIEIDGARSSAAAGVANMQLTFESTPSSGAYNHQRQYALATTVAGDENIGASDFILVGACPGATASANLAASSSIRIPGYSNGTYKTVICNTVGVITSIGTGNLILTNIVGLYESTAAIDRVRVTLSSGNWTTTSRLTVWGLPA